MPRRRPAAVRAALSPRGTDGPRLSVIDGVSARTLGEIHRWERATDRPGKVALDLRSWKAEAAHMSSRRWRGLHASSHDQGMGCPCCDYDAPEGRIGLERALQALSRRSRRELAAVVAIVDARVLRATYGDGPTEPYWWARRM